MQLSIILPCYNPPGGWDRNVISSYNRLREMIGADMELILVSDGNEPAIAANVVEGIRQAIPDFQYITYTTNRGKGYATRQGVAAARGDIILYTDVDFPYQAESVLAVYRTVNSGQADIAAGIKGDDYYGHVPPVRRMISRYLRAMTRVLLSLPVTDTQCGLKAFSRAAASVFLATTIDRYLFDLEFLRSAHRSRRFTIREVVIHLNHNVHFRKMNYRILLPELRNFLRILFQL
jgi:glycosyltransferase involved in cell wall biosynthesis